MMIINDMFRAGSVWSCFIQPLLVKVWSVVEVKLPLVQAEKREATGKCATMPVKIHHIILYYIF